jgi:hypothetical protein
MKQIADNFFKGMGTIELFPILPNSNILPYRSPWEGVAASFAKTGANLRSSMEYINVQSKPKSSK